MALLFLRFGLTAVGGPAAHIALIERECVLRRQWISRGEFADVLAVSSLIPGPTSTELATAQQMVQVDVEDVFAYFVRMGSLMFGSGSVLLPVLEGGLVERLG